MSSRDEEWREWYPQWMVDLVELMEKRMWELSDELPVSPSDSRAIVNLEVRVQGDDGADYLFDVRGSIDPSDDRFTHIQGNWWPCPCEGYDLVPKEDAAKQDLDREILRRDADRRRDMRKELQEWYPYFRWDKPGRGYLMKDPETGKYWRSRFPESQRYGSGSEWFDSRPEPGLPELEESKECVYEANGQGCVPGVEKPCEPEPESLIKTPEEWEPLLGYEPFKGATVENWLHSDAVVRKSRKSRNQRGGKWGDLYPSYLQWCVGEGLKAMALGTKWRENVKKALNLQDDLGRRTNGLSGYYVRSRKKNDGHERIGLVSIRRGGGRVRPVKKKGKKARKIAASISDNELDSLMIQMIDEGKVTSGYTAENMLSRRGASSKRIRKSWKRCSSLLSEGEAHP